MRQRKDMLGYGVEKGREGERGWEKKREKRGKREKGGGREAKRAIRWTMRPREDPVESSGSGEWR